MPLPRHKNVQTEGLTFDNKASDPVKCVSATWSCMYRGRDLRAIRRAGIWAVDPPTRDHGVRVYYARLARVGVGE